MIVTYVQQLTDLIPLVVLLLLLWLPFLPGRYRSTIPPIQNPNKRKDLLAVIGHFDADDVCDGVWRVEDIQRCRSMALMRNLNHDIIFYSTIRSYHRMNT